MLACSEGGAVCKRLRGFALNAHLFLPFPLLTIFVPEVAEFHQYSCVQRARCPFWCINSVWNLINNDMGHSLAAMGGSGLVQGYKLCALARESGWLQKVLWWAPQGGGKLLADNSLAEALVKTSPGHQFPLMPLDFGQIWKFLCTFGRSVRALTELWSNGRHRFHARGCFLASSPYYMGTALCVHKDPSTWLVSVVPDAPHTCGGDWWDARWLYCWGMPAEIVGVPALSRWLSSPWFLQWLTSDKAAFVYSCLDFWSALLWSKHWDQDEAMLGN